jgi:hypothetical protein
VSSRHFRAGLSHIAATRLAFALDQPLRFSEQLGRVLVSFSPAIPERILDLGVSLANAAVLTP